MASFGGNREFPIPRLDIDKEKALLFESLNEAKKAIKLRMEVATAMNLRTLTTLGRCRWSAACALVLCCVMWCILCCMCGRGSDVT